MFMRNHFHVYTAVAVSTVTSLTIAKHPYCQALGKTQEPYVVPND